jgi:biotin carboxyl carrier protein
MGEVRIKAEVAGRVCAVQIAIGADVKHGEDVAVIEAMKMEIPVPSPVAGKVRAILISTDDVVAEGQVLAIVET